MLRIILSMVLFMATSFALADLRAAFQAYDNKNYATAFKLYKEEAEKGNIHGQFMLGVMYEDGEGVAKDYKQAAMWYQKAADQGDARAQNNLGSLYRFGGGGFFSNRFTQDYDKAIYWYQKAANQGNANAQYNLGFMYDHGEGIDQDYKQAVEWYTKAADQGQKDAKGWFNYHRYNRQSPYKDLIAQADVERAQAFQAKAKQEEQRELELRKQEEQWERERMSKRLLELEHFRAGIKEGSTTNCGPVIEAKSTLIKVYFPIASFGNEHWIQRDSLFPSSYNCSFYNGQYIPPSP